MIKFAWFRSWTDVMHSIRSHSASVVVNRLYLYCLFGRATGHDPPANPSNTPVSELSIRCSLRQPTVSEGKITIAAHGIRGGTGPCNCRSSGRRTRILPTARSADAERLASSASTTEARRSRTTADSIRTHTRGMGLGVLDGIAAANGSTSGA